MCTQHTATFGMEIKGGKEKCEAKQNKRKSGIAEQPVSVEERSKEIVHTIIIKNLKLTNLETTTYICQYIFYFQLFLFLFFRALVSHSRYVCFNCACVILPFFLLQAWAGYSFAFLAGELRYNTVERECAVGRVHVQCSDSNGCCSSRSADHGAQSPIFLRVLTIHHRSHCRRDSGSVFISLLLMQPAVPVGCRSLSTASSLFRLPARARARVCVYEFPSRLFLLSVYFLFLFMHC